MFAASSRRIAKLPVATKTRRMTTRTTIKMTTRMPAMLAIKVMMVKETKARRPARISQRTAAAPSRVRARIRVKRMAVQMVDQLRLARNAQRGRLDRRVAPAERRIRNELLSPPLPLTAKTMTMMRARQRRARKRLRR